MKISILDIVFHYDLVMNRIIALYVTRSLECAFVIKFLDSSSSH